VGTEGLDRVGSEIPASTTVSDTLAQEEVKRFSGDTRRAEETKQTVHKSIMWVIKVVAIIIMAMLIFRAVYCFLPQGLRYLSTDQLATIDGVLLAFYYGIIGAIASKYIENAFTKNNPKSD